MGSSWTRDWTRISCIGRWILHHWATREALNDFFFFLTECFLSTPSVACPVGNIPPLQNLSLVLPSSYSALHNRASLSFLMTINNSVGKSARERSRAEETMGILVTLTYLLGVVALSGWPLSSDASCYQHSQPSSLCWPLPWPQAGPWDPTSLWMLLLWHLIFSWWRLEASHLCFFISCQSLAAPQHPEVF